jgi:4-amino-4-deoxy-L-arabinose transferase-like glycosyltransferase
LIVGNSYRRPNHLDAQKRHYFYLCLLAGLLFFPALGARDFWAPVEPRYAEIVRVMFINNEWMVPTINGDLYTDKPILYFWLALVCSKLAGAVNEWTVRFPAALGALGVVLTTYALGKNFFSATGGLIAATVLATSARVIWESRWAHVDTLFTFFFALSMYFAARVVLRQGNAKEIFLSYALMALATLTKGLIGVVLPALILLTFVLARRDWRLLMDARLGWGILVFLVVAAPWLILVTVATDGKWLTDFIYLHHIQRYTAGAGHREPFYYYFTTLPVDFLPWTIFAIPALFAYKLRGKLFDNPTRLFFALWFLVVFVFFTLSDTKRDLYLLPLFPPVALLVGNYIGDLAAGNLVQNRLYRGLSLLFFNSLWLGCLALPIATWVVVRDAFWPSLPVSLAMACGSIAGAYFVWHRAPLKVFVAAALTIVLAVLAASIWFLPFLERYKSPRLFAVEVKKRVPAATALYVYADAMHDHNFYTERVVIPVVASQAELQTLLLQEEPAYIMIRGRDLDRAKLIKRERIVFKSGAHRRIWYLIALGSQIKP